MERIPLSQAPGIPNYAYEKRLCSSIDYEVKKFNKELATLGFLPLIQSSSSLVIELVCNLYKNKKNKNK